MSNQLLQSQYPIVFQYLLLDFESLKETSHNFLKKPSFSKFSMLYYLKHVKLKFKSKFINFYKAFEKIRHLKLLIHESLGIIQL